MWQVSMFFLFLSIIHAHESNYLNLLNCNHIGRTSSVEELGMRWVRVHIIAGFLPLTRHSTTQTNFRIYSFQWKLGHYKGKRWHFGQRVILTDCLLEGVMRRANVYFKPQCFSDGQGEWTSQSIGLYLARSPRTLVGLDTARATPHTHWYAQT